MLDTIPYSIGVLTTTTTTNDAKVNIANTNIGTDDHVAQSSSARNHGNNEFSNDTTNFIEILSRGATLPAAGYSTFVLSELLQKGITVIAVEQIPISSSLSLSKQEKNANSNIHLTNNNSPRYQYNVIGEFTFLLHRLSQEQVQRLQNQEGNVRTVDVGMTLKESGEFVVSIFDPNDPDHIRKKQWYQKEKQAKDTTTKTRTTPITNRNGNTDTDLEPWTYEQIILMVGCCIIFVFYIVTKMTFPSSSLVTTTIMDES
jgi:hypothetical protein